MSTLLLPPPAHASGVKTLASKHQKTVQNGQEGSSAHARFTFGQFELDVKLIIKAASTEWQIWPYRPHELAYETQKQRIDP